jgi:hypothetical protein
MQHHKHLVYDLVATIEEESNHQLVAIPCENGTGLAVSDGADIRFVELDTLSSPETIRSYVAQWLSEPSLKPKRSRT